ncbi:transglutaminaseTgpA domain-containing protein [Luedemannella flava]
MNARHHVAVIGGIVTLLGSMSLFSVFATWSWFFYSTGAVIVVVGTAMLARSLRVPLWAQVLLMITALTIILTLYFPTGGEFLGLIPGPDTFRHFGELLGEAGAAIQHEAAPVPDLDGLLMIVTLGVGGVAIIVDLCAVGLRRPALAGLALLAIYSVPVAVLTTSVSVVQFAFGAAGFLWLLITDSVDRVRRFGRRFTGEGRDIDVWEPSPLAAAGRRLGVVGIVIAVLLPVAMPGLTTGFLDQLRPNTGGVGNGPGTGPGSGGTVDLSAMLTGSLQRDRPYNMVRVTTNDPAPYYLRFGVADQAGNDGFASRNTSGTGRCPPTRTPNWRPSRASRPRSTRPSWRCSTSTCTWRPSTCSRWASRAWTARGAGTAGSTLSAPSSRPPSGARTPSPTRASPTPRPRCAVPAPSSRRSSASSPRCRPFRRSTTWSSASPPARTPSTTRCARSTATSRPRTASRTR